MLPPQSFLGLCCWNLPNIDAPNPTIHRPGRVFGRYVQDACNVSQCLPIDMGIGAQRIDGRGGNIAKKLDF